MPIMELCDECHAQVGTCNCYDWPEPLTKVYRLEESVSTPGGRDQKTLKVFSTEQKAVNWLKASGYEEIKTGRPRWERATDQEAMFDVWVYVQIHTEEVE